MKIILKTAILTFSTLTLYLTVPLLENKNEHNAVAFPINIERKIAIKPIKPTPINKYQFNSKQKKELKCLAENMYHESKGEGSIGWLAVGMVTMNRVESKRYPNTICKVVYQNNGKVWQFSWAGTKKKLTKPKKVLYNKIYELAVLIYLYDEHLYDVTDDAIYFHADYVNPYWSKKVKKTVKIGSHIFYKN